MIARVFVCRSIRTYELARRTIVTDDHGWEDKLATINLPGFNAEASLCEAHEFQASAKVWCSHGHPWKPTPIEMDALSSLVTLTIVFASGK
jgi:hypothetical protein